MARKVFLNLPVRNVEHTIRFWKELGFSFNPQFTDEKAACMVISDDAFAMFLEEPFFRTFTERAICDAEHAVEGIFALSCESRAEVDALIHQALASGGSAVGKTMDPGFMYVRAFNDPDRHHWEVFWMDPAHVKK